MMAIGACGLMNAVGNLRPRVLAEMCEAVWRGDLATRAGAASTSLLEINKAVFFDTNPIPMKYMMKRLGFLASERAPPADGAGDAASSSSASTGCSSAPACSRSGRCVKLAQLRRSTDATSFGVVSGDGIVDLEPRARRDHRDARSTCLRAGALDELRELAGATRDRDFALDDVAIAAAGAGSREDLLHRRQLRQPQRGVQGRLGAAEISEHVLAHAGHRSSVTAQPLVRPPESEQLDYEGEIVLVIGKGGRRIAPRSARGARRRPTRCATKARPRLAAPRQVQRHAGQEFRSLRQRRAVARHRRRDRRWRAAASHDAVNGELRQDDTTANLIFPFARPASPTSRPS